VDVAFVFQHLSSGLSGCFSQVDVWDVMGYGGSKNGIHIQMDVKETSTNTSFFSFFHVATPKDCKSSRTISMRSADSVRFPHLLQLTDLDDTSLILTQSLSKIHHV
jgi:hypothetical protein